MVTDSMKAWSSCFRDVLWHLVTQERSGCPVGAGVPVGFLGMGLHARHYPKQIRLAWKSAWQAPHLAISSCREVTPLN